jgi:hypothetical protein
MRSLTANEFLLAREMDETHDAADRAVAVLTFAYPEETADDLRRLPLGRRNARLLDVRERLFGSELYAFAECPRCGDALELALDVRAIRAEEPEVVEEWEMEAEGYRLRFRLIDSRDLKAAGHANGVDDARALLVARCVSEAWQDDRTVTVDELPPSVIEQLSARLEEADPQAETLLALACPACAFQWQVPFDIASFLQAEISAHGRRLVREVHALARAYGWPEADILAMSTHRRREYLEMLSND